MKYEELLILLPCHSLEDFPLHHEGDDAAGLLASWTGMWHPALLAAAGALPTWCRVDSPPANLANRLLVLPSVGASQLPTGFAQRAKSEGACLIRKETDREKVVAQALEPLDGGAAGVDAELAADFLALGYCYLQVQLLTRQMRYSSNLDEVHFRNQAVGAAQAATSGDVAAAREKLQACFDLLAEERDHYYPVDAFILDLTLVAPTTIGASLREELARPQPTNVLLAAETAASLATSEPETLGALKQGLESGRVGLVGGEVVERRLPLMSVESMLGEITRGIEAYRLALGRRPTVYGRRRFGLSPQLPAILGKLGFRGALHSTLDDGTFPIGTQIKTRWEGSDGTPLEALARAPLDATKPETFLKLCTRMGESMDSDHVATICLAHWPGQASVWFSDLRRIAKYCSALGKFTTIDEYFEKTDAPPHCDRFEPDQYKSPYLKQAVIRKQGDPISSVVKYWQRRAQAEAVQTLDTLSCLITGDARQPAADLAREIDAKSEDADSAALDEQLTAAVTAAAQRFAGSLPRKSGPAKTGYLIANPSPFARRVGVETPALAHMPPVAKPIYAADESAGRKHVVVDLPPLGFAWVGSGDGPPKKEKLPKPLAEQDILRNEHFEALINPTTGSLQSIHEYKARGNRMSQQLAFRSPAPAGRAGDEWSDPDDSANYSVMAADSIDVTCATAALGEITARGRILDREGKTLAGYVQKYQLWRGSRVLLLDIELDPREEPRADPWNSYYAARFAWADESADLFRCVNQTRYAVSGKRFEAPHYVEVEMGPSESPTLTKLKLAGSAKQTTILTGGLPFHRRAGLRMLDSLLIVRGERQRRFRMGIGIDLTHPLHDAMGLLSPPPAVEQTAPATSPADSSWLFHIDAKNVIATYWSPVIADGRVAGFRARLLETAGRPAKAAVSCFRNVASARQLDFLGNTIGECTVEGGKLNVALSAHGWIEVEGTF